MTDAKTPLTGPQKVAVVLMNMDQQRAAQVMKQFSDEEADEITAEIMRLRRVDPGVAEKAMTEFHDLATRGAVSTRGGRDIAVGLLEASFGAERATGVLNRVASNMAGKQFEFLDAVEVTGVVLSKLDGTARGGVIITIQRELGLPVKLVGLGEAAEDLVVFDPEAFVDALLAP